MEKLIFKGCGTALATPFLNDSINYECLEKMIEFQIDQGVDSLIICGTTGENSTMTEEEKKEIIKLTVKIVNNRIPVIAGTGTNDTREVIKMNKYCEDIGVDGLLIVTPYYNKTTQKGLISHYGMIAEKTKLPIILYNVPSRTGMNIEPDICLELSKIKNIVAIKEASGNISQVAKIIAKCGKNLKVYSGNDDQIIPVLSLGGIGAISVFSNIEPKYVSQMIKMYNKKDTDIAKKMQLDSMELIENLFSEVNPIPIKFALNIYGYDFGIPRLPLIEMSIEKSLKLNQSISKFKNIKLENLKTKKFDNL